MFFATSTGKIFVYDFYNGCKELVFEYPKPTFTVDMIVYKCQKCSLAYQKCYQNNASNYKIFIVGDKRKIVIMNYQHKIGKASRAERGMNNDRHDKKL